MQPGTEPHQLGRLPDPTLGDARILRVAGLCIALDNDLVRVLTRLGEIVGSLHTHQRLGG